MIDSHLKYERDAIAGPGHKPTKPQPIPKMIAPKIRETPSLFRFGVSNSPDNNSFSLFKMYRSHNIIQEWVLQKCNMFIR